jgi:hypothetical protein
MALSPKRTVAAAILFAALSALAACAAPEPSTASTSGRLPDLGWTPPRMRAPSAERPAWLPSPPAGAPRLPAPSNGFSGPKGGTGGGDR